MGEMWQYQRPGFQPWLVAELQRQQRCNQYCDTMLSADGVSVPAHSCVLSALSPELSCALSASTGPPCGQKRSLEFHAAGARTMLQLVALLYSGEMAGEGERERQQALSAAAQLGIHGLVEVGDCKRTEAAVQTEPEQGVCPAPFPLQTIDLLDVQAAEDPRLLSLLQLPDGSQEPVSFSSSARVPLDEGSLATGGPPTLVLPVAPPPPGSLQCWGAETGEAFEQFEGNIPGFISYFLNQGSEEAHAGGGASRPARRRAGRRRGAREAGTAERRAVGKPRWGGVGARGLAQTVGVEKGSVSLPWADGMGRWGLRASRRGVGGGAVGRRFCLRRGELRKPIRMSLKRAGRSSAWEVSQAGERGGGKRRSRGKVQRGRSGPPLQRAQDSFSTTRERPHVTTAPALLHTAALPQEEALERLLDEVMMGLDMHQEGVAAPPLAGPGRAEPLPSQQGAATSDILDHFLRSFEQQMGSYGGPEPGLEDDGPPGPAEGNMPKSRQPRAISGKDAPGQRTTTPSPCPPSGNAAAASPRDEQRDEGRVVTRSRWKERVGSSVKPVLVQLQNALRRSAKRKTQLTDGNIPVPRDVLVPCDIPVPRDVPVPRDIPVPRDVPLPCDIPVPRDVPVPCDIPVPRDVPVPRDIPVPHDVPIPRDVPPVPCMDIALPKAGEEAAKATKRQMSEKSASRRAGSPGACGSAGSPGACDLAHKDPEQPQKRKRGRPPKKQQQPEKFKRGRPSNRTNVIKTRCTDCVTQPTALSDSVAPAKCPASQVSDGDAETKVHGGSRRSVGRAKRRLKSGEDPVSTKRAAAPAPSAPASPCQTSASGTPPDAQDVTGKAGGGVPAEAAQTDRDVSEPPHLPGPSQLKQIKIKLKKVHQVAQASCWVLSENTSNTNICSSNGDAAEAKPPAPPRHAAAKPLVSHVSLGSAGSCEEEQDDEEDVDVMGGSSPLPDPPPINWADVLIPDDEDEGEEEDEDIDVTI